MNIVHEKVIESFLRYEEFIRNRNHDVNWNHAGVIIQANSPGCGVDYNAVKSGGITI